MDQADFKIQVLELLGQLEKTIPFIEKVKIDLEKLSENGPSFDLFLEITTNAQNIKLFGATKTQLQPRHVHELLRQMKVKNASHRDENFHLLVVAEYISPRVAEILRDQRVSYLDLCGNCWLCFSTIYIEKAGKKHKVFERREMKSLFGLKSSRMIRLMILQPHGLWQVETLAKKTKLSLGQVSNIRRALLDQQYANVKEGGIKINNPETLLNSFALANKKNNVKQRLAFYTLLNADEKQLAIKQAMAEAKKNHSQMMLSGLSAARYQAPFATNFSDFFYADKNGLECLKKYLKLEPVKSGANVFISEPKDNFVFQEIEEPISGVFCTNAVQTYVDLFSNGEREREAAEHLLNHSIKLKWKELQKAQEK